MATTRPQASDPISPGVAVLMHDRHSSLDRQLDRACACCAGGAYFGALAKLAALQDKVAMLERMEASGLEQLGRSSRSSEVAAIVDLIDQAAGALDRRDPTAFNRAASDLRDALAAHQHSLEPAWVELDDRAGSADRRAAAVLGICAAQ